MSNQIQEAARQILGDVSDIQAELSMTGSAAMNIRLAAIREKAAFLYEGNKGVETIIGGYEQAARTSLMLLSDEIWQVVEDVDDAKLIRVSHLCEAFLSRCQVYFERKSRAIKEGSDVC
jgi:hypothetical protein